MKQVKETIYRNENDPRFVIQNCFIYMCARAHELQSAKIKVFYGVQFQSTL